MEDTDTLCTYCNLTIDTEEYGWGWYWEHYEKIPFHMECCQIVEDLHIEIEHDE